MDLSVEIVPGPGQGIRSPSLIWPRSSHSTLATIRSRSRSGLGGGEHHGLKRDRVRAVELVGAECLR